MSKDTQDRASESDIDLKSYLADAYLHPIFRSFEEVELVEVRVDDTKPPPQQQGSPTPSELSSPSPLHDHEEHADDEKDEASHSVQHYEVGQAHSVYQYEVEQPHPVYHYDPEQPYTGYHYEVESGSNVYRYDYESEPHYQYYQYWRK